MTSGEYMDSEIVNTGAYTVSLLLNEYQSGDNFTIEYKHATAQGDVDSDTWNSYTAPFTSLGYIRVRVSY